MKSARVSEALIGNIIAEPVFSELGNLLLKDGVVINEHVLNKLKMHEIDYIYIIDALTEGVTPKGIIEDEKMLKSVKIVQHVFDDVLIHERMGVKASVTREHIQVVKRMVHELMETLKSSEHILYTVVDLIDTDAYTYKHSVNVTVLSIITSKALGYSERDILNIALGSLLHDIGKVKVATHLLMKPGRLTFQERKEVEKHSEYGYELLEAIDGLPFTTKQIIRFHHEKLDGSGYPLGLQGIEIPEYVRVVTICDMFDAMTTDRVYRSKMPIYRALDILLAESVYKIDQKVYKVLLQNIAIYPVGTGVVLSDGRIGIVTSYQKHKPERPRVRVLNQEPGSVQVEIEEINLEENQILFIEETWDVEVTKAKKRNRQTN